MAKNSLTTEATQGFERTGDKYLSTSPSWYAYHLGLHFYVTGRTAPFDVAMSRGAKIRANGMLFEHVGKGDAGNQIFQRIS